MAKDYSGSYEENVKLHGKKKADEIGSARIEMLTRHEKIKKQNENMKPIRDAIRARAQKEHEAPHWDKK